MATDTGAINRTYLSSISFLDQREILKNVLDVAESESFLDVLDYMGRAVPSATIAYMQKLLWIMIHQELLQETQ